jgi:serine/threonine protein kinase/tetratricopeptide (TPR) repeat protein
MARRMTDGGVRELNRGDHVGRYVVVRPLGRGGMGVVYVARDERLGRDVALKMIAGLADEKARSRFWREARAAASVSHPHICQVFEVDESPEGIFLTMELLDGEALDRRLSQGALTPQQAVPIAIDMLDALTALHARGLVHRDIKPSNVFLTPHGPKLLDFGLARPALSGSWQLPANVAEPVSDAGMIVGTPQYMAPEQVTGAPVDSRTDVYAAGAVLFHMLAGRPPFTGSGADVLFAALKENPPALQGPPAVIAVDRVIRRAMRKEPGERYATAAQMAADLEAVSLAGPQGGATVPVRALTRVIVPPLRIAKTDPDVAFLSFGLAEAVSGTLATMGNLVVRSPALAARWSDELTDPRQLAAQADVDLVASSTLLRSGPQLRIATQLLDASSSTLIGSSTIKGSMDDIFALEDGLTMAVVEMLSTYLKKQSAPTPMAPVRRDVPANPKAFELFLRGMEHARELTQVAQARDLFEQALAEDPRFAPAWAALARCHRVYGKYYEDRETNEDRARHAFTRALEISPDLPLAHRYLTHFESEHGRAGDAIARLLSHARTNRHDAQLFAGLVHACRYAGLLEASMAAHEEAVRLDPNVVTSVEYTLAHFGHRVENAAQLTSSRGGFFYGVFPAIALGEPGNARELLASIDVASVPPAFLSSFDAASGFTFGPVDRAIPIIEKAITAYTDPEPLFMFGVMLARLGTHERAVEVVRGAVSAGYTPVSTLAHNHAFDAVRDWPAFTRVEAEARRRTRAAQDVFEAGGGPELLGLPSPTRLA